MILNILDNIEYNFCKKKKKKNKINIYFEYNKNLLINKNEISMKKIITSLNKITENNYYNIYFDIIDILNDNELNETHIARFIYKKIEQNSNFIEVYIKFLLLNEKITISFINFIQDKFENDLYENKIIINIIYQLHCYGIIQEQLLQSIIEYLFLNPKDNIDFILQFYKLQKSQTLKEKILNIPNLSYRYKFKLEC